MIVLQVESRRWEQCSQEGIVPIAQTEIMAFDDEGQMRECMESYLADDYIEVIAWRTFVVVSKGTEMQVPVQTVPQLCECHCDYCG